jgi:hypothetical protein
MRKIAKEEDSRTNTLVENLREGILMEIGTSLPRLPF